VPWGLRLVTAFGWRFLVLAAVCVVLARVFAWLYPVVMSLAVALLLSALLAPVVGWLVNRGVQRTLAAVMVLIGGLAVVGGVLAVVVITVVNGLPGLQRQITQSVQAVHQWLRHGPLHLSQGQLDQGIEQLLTILRSGQADVTAGVLSTAGTLFEFLSSLLLVLFTLLFFLRDGRKIWSFVLRVSVPASARVRVEVAGSRGFDSLVAYVRATAAVAFMDAAGVGIGTALAGVPLAAVLAALVFLGAFVPYIGSLVSGSIAVVVALVTTGLFPALVVLAVVVGVMQLEGHVLQPLILGRAVRLHPLAVVLGITAGFLLAGVAGAVLAVPVIAVLNTAARSLTGDDPEDTAGNEEPQPQES
jgi:predicted PurR-regulated permease PerM